MLYETLGSFCFVLALLGLPCLAGEQRARRIGGIEGSYGTGDGIEGLLFWKTVFGSGDILGYNHIAASSNCYQFIIIFPQDRIAAVGRRNVQYTCKYRDVQLTDHSQTALSTYIGSNPHNCYYHHYRMGAAGWAVVTLQLSAPAPCLSLSAS
jgi:hypothetical protein